MMVNKDEIYPLYKFSRKFIEKVEKIKAEQSICYEALAIDFRKAVKTFDELSKNYAERYEKEKEDERTCKSN